ncbi:jg22801 [Pararge aegeria aegeria]|uniref:Jg22801 protein n=1 Tax=Pararge aegeria aegeria TaxID=348720 RepID=A0A8S4RVC1_9NEOP|nr:jg22801 [Pararge aegeria aegeria]
MFIATLGGTVRQTQQFLQRRIHAVTKNSKVALDFNARNMPSRSGFSRERAACAPEGRNIRRGVRARPLRPRVAIWRPYTIFNIMARSTLLFICIVMIF